LIRKKNVTNVLFRNVMILWYSNNSIDTTLFLSFFRALVMFLDWHHAWVS